MKKAMFSLWMCVLCAPMLLMFVTDEFGNVTMLNVFSLAYTIFVCKFWRMLMPSYMVRYIDRFCDMK